MRKPTSSNFERMRLEAERLRLADLEAEAAKLRATIEAQAEARSADVAQFETALAAQSDQGASRIAELEARCEDLSRQLEARDAESKGTAERLSAETMALAERIEAFDASVGDPDRLRRAIAPVLPAALRDAGAGSEGHGPVTSAIAPYIVPTVRAEILNSEDELVEAIHPKLGVLIAAAVTNAIDELNQKVDAALPIDRWIASLKSRLTGAPAAGFLLENGNRFVLREAMLIERNSGLLILHEYAALSGEVLSDAPDEDLMAGMIAALQSFAGEAYGPSGAGDLRRFSFTSDTVYLRATPTKILAVRCSGVAPPEIERRVDGLLEGVLERLRDGAVPSDGVLRVDAFNAPQEEADTGLSASTILGRGFGLIAAAIALIWGHGAVTGAHEARWFGAIEAAVRSDADLAPYPLKISQADVDSPVRITGLIPSQASREMLERRIDWIATPLGTVVDVAIVPPRDRQ